MIERVCGRCGGVIVQGDSVYWHDSPEDAARCFALEVATVLPPGDGEDWAESSVTSR